MLSRSVLKADVVRVNATTRPGPLGDLTLGPVKRDRQRTNARGLLFPYVFDLARARTSYIAGLDLSKLRKAPFSYAYATRQAKSVLFVPWEVGRFNGKHGKTDPLYVFSPGRCGTTLLHNILSAANISSVSEPGVHHALLSRQYRKQRVLRPLLKWVTRVYARDLVSALGGPRGSLVVKLHSNACWVAPQLLEGSQERRTIFMVRQFETYAQSYCEHFDETPRDLVNRYRQSLRCYAYLRQHNDCCILHYEDIIANPNGTMTKLAKFLGDDIPNGAIERAMSVHSQAGTSLERVTEEGRARWNARREDTFRYWHSSGAAELSSRLVGY